MSIASPDLSILHKRASRRAYKRSHIHSRARTHILTRAHINTHTPTRARAHPHTYINVYILFKHSIYITMSLVWFSSVHKRTSGVNKLGWSCVEFRDSAVAQTLTSNRPHLPPMIQGCSV